LVAWGAVSQLRQALAVVRRDERVALLGAMQALFESSMYAFVFLWTPALGQGAKGGAGEEGGGGWGGASAGAGDSSGGNNSVDEALPHGLIFAIFMLASMLGAAIAGRLMEEHSGAEQQNGHHHLSDAGDDGAAAANDGNGAGSKGPSPSKAPRPRGGRLLLHLLPAWARGPWRVEAYMQAVYAVSALSMVVPAACHWRVRPNAAAAAAANDPLHLSSEPQSSSSSTALVAQLLAFCAFEVATGAFWPSMMQMRAKYLPEAQRSTLMALFRAPLSACVCLMLWRAADVPLWALFACCAALLAGAGGCQRRLARITAVPVSGVVGVGWRGVLQPQSPRKGGGGDEEQGGGGAGR
jgi:hypothetical protein